MKKIKQYLIQKKWFRNLFKEKTFYLTNGVWKYLSDFSVGEKIEKVEGKWSTQAFCRCGNELVHSQSFLTERFVEKTNMYVYDYRCTYCNEFQHRNPSLMVGIHSCNKDGILL